MTTYPFESMKVEKITAPCGSWKSPITPAVVSGTSKLLGGTAVDSLGRLLWLESRPDDSGYLYLTIHQSVFHSMHIEILNSLDWFTVYKYYVYIYRRKVVVWEPEGAGDEPIDITPKEYAVQTMAQGSETGSAVSVSRDTDTLVFSNYNDQRLYKQSTTG